MEYPLFQAFSSQDATISNAIIIGTIAMAVALIIGAMWLIYSSLDNKYGLSHSFSHRVENLYVKISYRAGPTPQEFKSGYLISLGLNRASLVISDENHLPKGSYVYLYFDSPSSESPGDGISGKISKVKCIRHDPKCYRLDLHFAKSNKSALTAIEKSIMQFSTRWHR